MHMNTFLFFSLVYTIYSEGPVIVGPIITWSDYKRAFGLNFSAEEDKIRKAIFLDNLDFINEYNEKKNGIVLAVNKFAHKKYTEDSPKIKIRVKSMMQGIFESKKSKLPIRYRVDWRDYKVVTRVKDQRQCGSCYAFSGVGAIESMFAIKTGAIQEFSEQEIVDCSSGGDEGCDGGYPESVFQYVVKNGISSEVRYEYHAAKNVCRSYNQDHSHKLLSYVSIPQGDEQRLLRALSFEGPVSVALDAAHREFRFYKSGVLFIDGCNKEELDHAVLAVGYNLYPAKPFIIVKNSWGEDWGEDGYFRMVLNENMCGIASAASYPVIKI